MPASMKRLVDLPQPEGPSSATNSPSSIVRFMSRTASTSPNRLTTWRNSTVAASSLHAADRHLHQISLRGEVENKARDEIEDTDRRNYAVIDAHHVVADVVHVEAHRPVGV